MYRHKYFDSLDNRREKNKSSWEVSEKRIHSSSIGHLKRLIGKRKVFSLSNNTYERELFNKILDEDFKPLSVKGFMKPLRWL